jgi:hypothetical protein
VVLLLLRLLQEVDLPGRVRLVALPEVGSGRHQDRLQRLSGPGYGVVMPCGPAGAVGALIGFAGLELGRLLQHRLCQPVVGGLHATGKLFGRWYPHREAYASNESWGTDVWSYLAIDRPGAEKRFAEVARRTKTPARVWTRRQSDWKR